MVTRRKSLFLAILCLAAFGSAEIQITRHPRNTTVLNEKRCVLHCEATGNNIRIRWYHENREMPRRGGNYRIMPTGKLRFHKIHVTDRGIYQCKAESGPELVVSRKAHVSVQAPAVIILPPRDSRFVPYGEPVQLTCQVAGIPRPKVKWKKNGFQIINPKPTEMLITYNITDPKPVLTTTLYIHNVTDNATYECEAKNQHVAGDTVVSHYSNVIVLLPRGRKQLLTYL